MNLMMPCTQGWPYVLVVATSDIEEGEELQIDYGEQVLCLGHALFCPGIESCTSRE